MRSAFMDAIMASCKDRDDVFIISGDAGLGVFDRFKEQFPGRFLNLGVAEQNTISFAAGMALAGHKSYVYNIIPFVLYRCYEQVRNDICYQRLPVTLVGIGSGITYAPQGMTHYAVEDLGIAQTLPNLTVFSPSDPIEARRAAEYSLSAPGPVYARLAKKGEPCIHKTEQIDITVPQCVKEGETVAVIFHGSISTEVLLAEKILKQQGMRPQLISLPMVQPLPEEKLFEMLEGFEYVFSVEEHFLGTGLGSTIGKAYLRRRPEWKFFSLGIHDSFIHEVKDTACMRDHFGISADKIAARVNAELKKE